MANTDAKHPDVLEGAKARLARVYAEALLAVVGPEQAEAVGEDLTTLVKEVLVAHPAIEAFLANGAIGRKVKAQFLDQALGTTLPEPLRNLLGVLNQNGRLGLLRAIQAAYQKLLDEAAGRVRVQVTSAIPLQDEQLTALKQTLTTTLRANPVLETRTDPELLGGLVVRVGDRVYDTSVRTRLETLRTHLLASGTYGSA